MFTRFEVEKSTGGYMSSFDGSESEKGDFMVIIFFRVKGFL